MSETIRYRPWAEPGAAAVTFLPKMTEQPGAGRRELHHAEALAVVEVGVEPPPEVRVELLRAIDVRNGDDDDLELHVDARAHRGLLSRDQCVGRVLCLAERSVGETRAIGQSSRVFAAANPYLWPPWSYPGTFARPGPGVLGRANPAPRAHSTAPWSTHALAPAATLPPRLPRGRALRPRPRPGGAAKTSSSCPRRGRCSIGSGPRLRRCTRSRAQLPRVDDCELVLERVQQ